MKNICIVQGGSFLLGISEQDILGRMPWAEAVPLLRQDGGAVVQLGALLARQPGGTPPPDAVCLELRGVFLVVDQIAAVGVELINPPGPLPPACPRLAARLCPQVTIWGDTPVLLLEPAQLLPVAEELGGGIGMAALPEEFCRGGSRTASTADETADEEPENEFFTEKITEPKEAAETEAQPPAVDDELPAATDEKRLAFLDEEEPVVEPESEDVKPVGEAPCACPSDQEEVKPQPEPPPSPERQKEESAAIDEETFKKVMAWTVACFKRRQPDEELRLGIEQLPPELAALVRKKGLSSSIIQYLIDQIVLRCQDSASRKTPDGKKYAG
ncbi:hypothetical protein [Candidatus Electronema sp. JC]|uniref:hypothetical protein n=1 Tax=Candidatus Electronema sp. JC TaxID=3401570 RepID=UPI003B42FC78